MSFLSDISSVELVTEGKNRDVIAPHGENQEKCECASFSRAVGRSLSIAESFVEACSAGRDDAAALAVEWGDSVGSGYLMLAMRGLSESVPTREPVFPSKNMLDGELCESMKWVASSLRSKHDDLKSRIASGECPCALAMECFADQAVFSDRAGEYIRRLSEGRVVIHTPWRDDSAFGWAISESDEGSNYYPAVKILESERTDKLIDQVSRKLKALSAMSDGRAAIGIVSVITELMAVVHLLDVKDPMKKRLKQMILKNHKIVFNSK